MGKMGLSWSAKRALGISGAKTRFARKTGICTTRAGWERKLGRSALGIGLALAGAVASSKNNSEIHESTPVGSMIKLEDGNYSVYFGSDRFVDVEDKQEAYELSIALQLDYDYAIDYIRHFYLNESHQYSCCGRTFYNDSYISPKTIEYYYTDEIKEIAKNQPDKAQIMIDGEVVGDFNDAKIALGVSLDTVIKYLINSPTGGKNKNKSIRYIIKNDEEFAAIALGNENWTHIYYENGVVWLKGERIKGDVDIAKLHNYYDAVTEEEIEEEYHKRYLQLAMDAIATEQSGLKNKNGSSVKTITSKPKEEKKGGCYIATCVYGSYDCPNVWVLRRFRDNVLLKNNYGRIFVKFYYFISPKLVKLFGDYEIVRKLWKYPLDLIVLYLKNRGYGEKQ